MGPRSLSGRVGGVSSKKKKPKQPSNQFRANGGSGGNDGSGAWGKPIVNFTHIQSQSIIAHESPFHKHSESEMLRAARRGSLFLSFAYTCTL